MAQPPTLPTFDASRLQATPGLAAYHQSLLAFLRDTVAALSGKLTLRQNLASAVRGPFSLTVPDDWRDVTPAETLNGWELYPTDAGPLGNHRLAYAKDPMGLVRVKGLAKPGAYGFGGTGIVFRWPDKSFYPEQIGIFYTSTYDGGLVELYVTNEGVEATTRISGGAILWVTFDNLWFVAKDRTPPAWGKPFPLFVECPFTPAVVLVDAVEVVSGAPQGLRLAPMVEWKPERRATQQGLNLTRLPGLTPGKQYSLTVYALAG